MLRDPCEKCGLMENDGVEVPDYFVARYSKTLKPHMVEGAGRPPERGMESPRGLRTSRPLLANDAEPREPACGTCRPIPTGGGHNLLQEDRCSQVIIPSWHQA